MSSACYGLLEVHHMEHIEKFGATCTRVIESALGSHHDLAYAGICIAFVLIGLAIIARKSK